MGRLVVRPLLFLGHRGGCTLPRAVSAASPAAPTFSKDVLPILQKNCQCHRPGAIAPMSFWRSRRLVHARHS
jgi:hypothetical protein